MIQYLIEQKVNLEFKNNNKRRPIHFLCRYSTPEMIKFMIDKGVKLNCKTKENKLPIDFLIERNMDDVVEYINQKILYSKE